MSKITYANKVALNGNAEISDINKVTDNDMNEIKAVVNNNDDESIAINTKLTNATTYSTNEIRVGTWIDGKPIYRKVITITAFSTSGITVNTGITNINEIVNVKGTFYRSELSKYYSLDNIYINEWSINKTNGEITIATTNQYVTFTGYIILEYTKTTDV